MLRHRSTLILVLLATVLALGVLVVRQTLAPPSVAPAYDGPRPVERPSGYVTVTHDVVIAAPPPVVQAWMNDPERPLGEIVRFDGFPAVVATRPLRGDWVPGSREGDRRRVTFADGHHLAEEVLVDAPDRFRYVIWGFTAPQRLAVDHGVAEFRHRPTAGGTHLSWTYAFLPTTGLVRPAVGHFLESTMTPMMTATLSGIRDGVEAER